MKIQMMESFDGEEPRDDEYSSNEFQQHDTQHKVPGRRGPIGKNQYCRVVAFKARMRLVPKLVCRH
jgi:hypothetical protein